MKDDKQQSLSDKYPDVTFSKDARALWKVVFKLGSSPGPFVIRATSRTGFMETRGVQVTVIDPINGAGHVYIRECWINNDEMFIYSKGAGGATFIFAYLNYRENPNDEPHFQIVEMSDGITFDVTQSNVIG